MAESVSWQSLVAVPTRPQYATIAKVDDARRNIFGWAYTSVEKDGNQQHDTQGDAIDTDVLEAAAYDHVLNSRASDEMHLKEPIGTLIESMVFTAEKIAKLGVPPGVLPEGWWVGYHVTNDATWQAIKEGRYRAFSIGGRAFRDPVDGSGGA